MRRFTCGAWLTTDMNSAGRRLSAPACVRSIPHFMNLQLDIAQLNAAALKAGAIRPALAISCTLTRQERNLLSGTIEYATSQSPLPVKLYLFPQKGIITGATACKLKRVDDTIANVQAFVKARLPINSYVPGALLRLPFPGEILVGYVNPEDVKRLNDWLQSESSHIADQIEKTLGEAIEAAVPQTTKSTVVSRGTAPVLTRPTVTIGASKGRFGFTF